MAGSTYALFTSQSETNIAINSGKVDVKATIGDWATYSGKELTGIVADDEAKITATEKLGLFSNGGTAEIEDNVLKLKNMTPGDKVTLDINVKNDSTVNAKYRTFIKATKNTGLFKGLKITIDEEEFSGFTAVSSLESFKPGEGSKTVHVTIDFPTDKGNEYQGKACEISFSVEAYQNNAAVTEAASDELGLYTLEDFIAFSQFSNTTGWASEPLKDYKTITLMADMDLTGVDWDPINFPADTRRTFDGNGKTISNLTLDTENEKVGLFRSVSGKTIKNVNLTNAYIKGSHWVGGIAGHAIDTTFSNCVISNSNIINKVANNDNGDKTGAIVGYLGDSTNVIEGCKVKDVNLKGYRDIGGLAGIVNTSGTTIASNTLENVSIINDRSQNPEGYADDSADYNVGEVIGRNPYNVVPTDTICKNVTIKIEYADGFEYDSVTRKYSITSKTGLYNFASYVNAGNTMNGKTVELKTDVDLQNEKWQPINNFQGTFDGCAHKIENLHITWNSTEKYGNWRTAYIGFFGNCAYNSEADLVIENIVFKNVDIDATGYNYGMYVGTVLGGGTANINDVTVEGLIKIKSDSWYVGGIAGGVFQILQLQNKRR